jgi:hypothetical protein
MLDIPKDIPEEIADAGKPKKKAEKPVEDDVSIADLGGDSIMAEDHTVKELLAEETRLNQIAAAEKSNEIPAAPAVPTLAGAVPAAVVPAATVQAAAVPKGPTVPDFRGKSMSSVVEEASADGIELTIEGSGVARAQLPLPGQPMRPGERIRIVFAR